MSINLLTSPNSRNLYCNSLNVNEVSSDIVNFNVNKVVKTVSLQATTNPINDMVYTKQTITYHQYGKLVIFSIDIQYSNKGASGSGGIYIDLNGVSPLPAPNKQLIESFIDLSDVNGLDTLPRTSFVINNNNVPRIELTLSRISDGTLIAVPFTSLPVTDGFINIQGHYFST